MPIASLSDLKKEEEEEGKGTSSYAGGEKSGLAIQNPDDDRWKAMQAHASGGPSADARQVTMYRNGFTVDDGPFRSLDDPLNKKFLDDMARGQCPEELKAGGAEDVKVAVHDKRGEDYKAPPPPAYTKFSGEGNTLSGTASSSAAAPVEASAGTVSVDSSKPTTKIQIRFHDGSRKAQEFNQDQTVGDLRLFCSQCAGGVNMTVKGGFPPKALTDDSQTLKDAGLCGAAVTVMPA